MDTMLMATIEDNIDQVLKRLDKLEKKLEKKLDQILIYVENIENGVNNDQTS